jgi:hypothetical protein
VNWYCYAPYIAGLRYLTVQSYLSRIKTGEYRAVAYRFPDMPEYEGLWGFRVEIFDEGFHRRPYELFRCMPLFKHPRLAVDFEKKFAIAISRDPPPPWPPVQLGFWDLKELGESRWAFWEWRQRWKPKI